MDPKALASASPAERTSHQGSARAPARRATQRVVQSTPPKSTATSINPLNPHPPRRLSRRSTSSPANPTLSVFFTFGIAATTPGFIGGGQFDHLWFTWATAAVCFALGLTYLDVWTAQLRIPRSSKRLRQRCDPVVGVLGTIPGCRLRRLAHGTGVSNDHAVHAHRCWTRDAVSVLPSEVDTPAGHWMVWFKKLAGVMLILTACWLLGGWELAIGVLATVFYAGRLGRCRKPQRPCNQHGQLIPSSCLVADIQDNIDEQTEVQTESCCVATRRN